MCSNWFSFNKTTTRSFLLLLMFTLLAKCPLVAQTIKGTYAIKNVATGMVLRVKDASSKNETPIVAYTPTNWKCMTWNFEQVSDNTYRLKNLFTGKTFQPATIPASEAVRLQQQPFVAGEVAQQWEFLPQAPNVYLIRLKGTELYVTPADANGSINSLIGLAKKRQGDNTQQWTIYAQHPTM